MDRPAKLHVLPIAIGKDSVARVACPALGMRVAAADCAACPACMHLSQPGDVRDWVLVCNGTPAPSLRDAVERTLRAVET